MSEVSAKLNSYRHSPRKVRVVANTVRGKSVKEALQTLTFLTKKAGSPLAKLINSGVSNARVKNLDTDNLYIKEIRVDGGAILYRRRSASRGRAPIIRKRTSNIILTLVTKEAKPEKKKAKKEAKVETK